MGEMFENFVRFKTNKGKIFKIQQNNREMALK